MSNLIQYTEDLYREFLRGIRRENTSVVKPSYFNPFINRVMLSVIKSKLPEAEFNQKRIDDLEILRVVTDGSSLSNAYQPIQAASNGIFKIPSYWENSENGIPMAEPSTSYPLYLWGLNASFKRRDDAEWKPGFIRKSDKTVLMGDNPYRKPTTERIYFERIGGEIRMIGGNQEDTLRLEYFRYPRLINFSTVQGEVINPEFGPSMCQEIADAAIREYLETSSDMRYKTILQEEMIKSRSK